MINYDKYCVYIGHDIRARILTMMMMMMNLSGYYHLKKRLTGKTHHVLDVKNKANTTLGCIKRNLHPCPESVKAQAYTSLVRLS